MAAERDPRSQSEANVPVADSLRAAIQRTLAATGPAAAETRERAEELVEGISRRGSEARSEVVRRGEMAGAEIARLGREARSAITRGRREVDGELREQVETLERRLASLEERLGGAQDPQAGETGDPNPQAKE